MFGKLILCLVILSVLFIYSCKEEEKQPPTGVNLIENSSFENENGSDFSGWSGDSYSFVTDVPDSNEKFSLKIQPGWWPTTGYVTTNITGYTGKFRFRLSAMSKSFSWTGQLRLIHMDGNGIKDMSQVNMNSATWQQFEVTDEFELIPEDHVIVEILIGSSEVSSGYVLVDKVSLVRF
jgi:hypothetical protein